MTSHDFPSKRCHIYLSFSKDAAKVPLFFQTAKYFMIFVGSILTACSIYVLLSQHLHGLLRHLIITFIKREETFVI